MLGQSLIYSGYFMITRRDQRRVVIGTSLKFIQRQVVIRTSLKFIQSILGLQKEIKDTFCFLFSGYISGSAAGRDASDNVGHLY